MKKKLSKPRRVNNHLWHYKEEGYVIQRTWSLLLGKTDNLFFIYKSYADCESGSHMTTATDFYGAKRILTHLLNGDDELMKSEVQNQRDITEEKHSRSRAESRKELERKHKKHRSWR
jgi:hypothetical protein